MRFTHSSSDSALQKINAREARRGEIVVHSNGVRFFPLPQAGEDTTSYATAFF